MLKQKSKIQTALVICGLLLATSFDNVQAAKTQKSKNKPSSSASSSSSGRVNKPVTNTQTHANPAAFSYGNVKPNAPQPVKPSAPVQQSYAPKPVYNQPQAAPSYPANNPGAPAPGWNVAQNNQARPPYPVNNNQQFGNPPPYSQHPNQGPPPVYASNPGQPAATNFNQQPPAYRPPQQQQPAYNPQQPAYNPQQPAYNPQQPAYNPQQPAYHPQPGYQQPAPGGFAPPPQVVNNYHITPGQTGGGFGQPQQSGGPGLLKTAVVAGAAGLGGAALYNAFKPDNDPKTTVVYVTQPPVAAAPAPVAAAAPAPAQPEVQPVQPQQQYPQQPYPQQPYPQQPYPQQPYQQQPYPQQPYDPNNPNQQYSQQYIPNQPLDPNQQQFTPIAPAAVPVPAVGEISTVAVAPVDAQSVPTTVPVVSSETTTSVAAVDSTVNAALTGSSTNAAPEVSSIPPPEMTTASSSTILANNPVSPVAARSERMGEVVEQKMATVVDQPVPKPSESKVGNSGSALKYSVTLFLLSFFCQFLSKKFV